MKKNFLRSFFGDFPSGEEDRISFIQSRIQLVQKNIPGVRNALMDYVNKNSGLTDCEGKIASTLENYAKAENLTTGTNKKLSDFSSVLRKVSSRRNDQITSMESNVLQELGEYGKMCKNVNSELKSSLRAYDRVRTRLKQLKRAEGDHAGDRQHIASVEAEYVTARCESCRSGKNLEEQMDVFERRRIQGIRQVLISWTLAELRFHAKALELFTEAYNIAASIDVNADIEEFRNRLRIERTPRLDSSRDTSFNRSDSLIQLRKSLEKPTAIGIPHPEPSHGSVISDVSDANRSSIF